MRLWLGLDLETTGFSVTEDEITEIGAVLWDVVAKAPVQIFSQFVKIKGVLTPEIQKITGIKPEYLERWGVVPEDGFNELLGMIEQAECVVAHNGEKFDRPMLRSNMKRAGLELPQNPFWLDSCIDIEYACATRKLGYLAAEHGFLNPFPHRAVTDVLTMMQVVSKYDADTIFSRAQIPNITIQAVVTREHRQKAKDRGYHWDGDNVRWTKVIKSCDYAKECEASDFKVIQLMGG
jgi:DNA polymerase-3 subunit epsilon